MSPLAVLRHVLYHRVPFLIYYLDFDFTVSKTATGRLTEFCRGCDRIKNPHVGDRIGWRERHWIAIENSVCERFGHQPILVDGAISSWRREMFLFLDPNDRLYNLKRFSDLLATLRHQTSKRIPGDPPS